MNTQELATQADSPITEINSANDIMMNLPMLAQIDQMAVRMAEGKATIPKHLQGNVGDCWAVAMQAVQWRMNPFAVAQKTHVTQGGALGYEAQLINAAITTLAPISSRPDYEFLGDWNKILGQVEERKGSNGGKYYVAAWNKKLEEGLGVICRCTLIGEDSPREITVMMSQCYPRFSTQWATDPQQQITYVAVRKWARRFTPDVILGVYTPDELRESDAQPEKEIGPGTAAASDINDMLKQKTEAVQDDAEDAEVIEADEESAELEPEAEAKPDPEPKESGLTVAAINTEINAAETAEDMAEVRATILHFLSDPDNKQFGDELNAAYKHKVAEFKKQQEAEAFGDE